MSCDKVFPSDHTENRDYKTNKTSTFLAKPGFPV
jgi:hypothetical protein